MATDIRPTQRPRSERRPLADLRAKVRDHRRARSAYRALEADLATYNQQTDIDDLLAAIADDDGPDAEQIRDILVRKQGRGFAA